MQLDVAITAALVLEEATAVGALKGHLVAVDLLMPLEVGESVEGPIAELALIR